MAAPTLAALLPTDRPVTKDDILRAIVRKMVPPFFIHRHIRRERVLGTIGEKGGGKSATTATVGLVDEMIDGRPVYSNIDIACDIVVSDMVAKQYGLNSGGTVHYKSEPLDKERFLNHGYTKCATVIEEINIQFANVRRFMANTNVDFNEVCQQLRHDLVSLYYNVIDEMFIDPQLRSMTDAFIKCEDTAYNVDSLASKKPQGEDIKWLIYPINGNFAGHEKVYSKTHKPLDPVYFHFNRFHGIYDTEISQRKGIYSHSRKTKAGEMDMMISTESSQDMVDELNEWDWLGEKARVLKNSGISELESWQLWQHLGIAEKGISPRNHDFINHLAAWGIRRYRQNKVGQWLYKIDNFELDLTNKQSAIQRL